MLPCGSGTPLQRGKPLKGQTRDQIAGAFRLLRTADRKRNRNYRRCARIIDSGRHRAIGERKVPISHRLRSVRTICKALSTDGSVRVECTDGGAMLLEIVGVEQQRAKVLLWLGNCHEDLISILVGAAPECVEQN